RGLGPEHRVHPAVSAVRSAVALCARVGRASLAEIRETGRRESAMRVEGILEVAQRRLATVADDALLIDAARLLNGPQFNLVVVCDDSRKAVGVITKTDVVSRISYCTGCSCSMQ